MISGSPRVHPLLRALLSSMGLTASAAALVACGGNVVFDKGTSTGGDGGGGSGGSGSTSSTTATSTCTVQGLGTPVDVCVPIVGDACPLGETQLLQAAGDKLAVCADISAGSCCNEEALIGVLCVGPPGDMCCYTVDKIPSGLCVGRPFLVEGTPRVAAPMPRSDWAKRAGRPRLAMDARTREAVRDAWLADAALEHASIASFARLALELVALGAPPDLLRGAQSAMGDEIEHAELCYALASAFSDAPMGPSVFSMDGAFSIPTLDGVAAAAVREGCIGETIAALIATRAAASAEDPAVSAALKKIAADETEHAALSFRLVAWAWRTGSDATRAAITSAFRAASLPDVPALPSGIDEVAWRAAGRLTPEETRAAAAEVITEVIQPAFASLAA